MYPRTHITSDMCIPSNMTASDIGIPYPPPLHTTACFVFVIFFTEYLYHSESFPVDWKKQRAQDF